VGLRFFNFVAACWALALASTVHGAPMKPSVASPDDVNYIRATCKVFVTEAGTPKTVQVLKLEPSLSLSESTLQSLIVKPVLTWTFTPTKKNGKSVAGYIVVVIDIDLAPVTRDGT